MTKIISWKMFFTQLSSKTKSEFLIYGNEFPTFAFCLPEEAQVKVETKSPVNLVIPKGSSALGYILEALPSVVDIAYNNPAERMPETKLGVTTAIVSNEEFEERKEVIDIPCNQESMLGLTTKQKRVMYPIVKKGPYWKHITHSWKFDSRYNRSQIAINIEKWNVSLNEIIEIMYKNARHSAQIPILHTQDQRLVIPDLFLDRYKMALESRIICFKSTKLPYFNEIGGINQWISLQSNS